MPGICLRRRPTRPAPGTGTRPRAKAETDPETSRARPKRPKSGLGPTARDGYATFWPLGRSARRPTRVLVLAACRRRICARGVPARPLSPFKSVPDRSSRAGSAFPVWALLIDRRRTASAEDFNPNHFTLKNRSRAQDIGLLSSGDRSEAGGPVRWAVRGHTGSPEILIPLKGIR